MRERLVRLLRMLTELHGAPGHEGAVKAAIRGELDGFADLSEDRMGSLIAGARGNQAGPAILLAAHMDEVGFMVREITAGGFVRFAALGDWWDQVLLGQRVIIKTHQGDVPGVIGAVAPHLLSPEQRRRPVSLSEMFIDVGAFSAAETQGELGVRVGDAIVPAAPFTLLRDGDFVLSKALDDRVGCALIIECLKSLAEMPHPNRVYGAFTVREEIGRANSSLCGWEQSPDVCFIIEVGLPADTPATPAGQASQDRLGGGVTLVTYDGVLLPSAALLDFVIQVSKETGIPCQPTAILGTAGSGTTTVMYDVPSLCLGVPIRYAHSHGSLMYLPDYEHALALLVHLMLRLDQAALIEIRRG